MKVRGVRGGGRGGGRGARKWKQRRGGLAASC